MFRKPPISKYPPSVIPSSTIVTGYKSILNRPMIQNIESFYKLKKKLGSGGFGTVYLGQSLQHGYDAAVKIIHKSNVHLNQSEQLQTEVEILTEVGKHENIVSLYEALETPYDIIFVMELCYGGELFDAIVNSPHFKFEDEDDVAHVMKDGFKAIAYLHDAGIVHRDLKPENLMLSTKASTSNSEYPTIKVIDFGLSKHYNKSKKMTEHVGTSYYMAPEVLKDTYEGGSSDMWSLGVILYILLSGKPPFDGPNDKVIQCRVLSGEKHQFKEDDFGHVSEDAKDLINRLLERDPKKRITAREALMHPFIVSHSFGLPSTTAKKPFSRETAKNLKMFYGSNKFIKMARLQLAKLLRSDQISDLQELFSDLDVDNSGTLSCREIKKLLQKEIKKTNNTSAIKVSHLFGNLDVDHDGEISYLEFIAGFMNTQQWSKKEMLQKIFDKFDSQKTQKLTRDDLMAVLSDGKSDENAILIEEMLEKFDLDHDGNLTYNEFEAVMLSET